MADNPTIINNSGNAGTDVVVAADDIAGVQYQRVKPVHGADGSATDTSTANPLPVVQTGTPALPTGAATAAKQPALGTAGSSSTDVLSVQGIASGTPLPISGSMSITGTTPVSQALPVQASTATLANVSGATSSTTLIASNANRKGLVIVNDSTAILYVKFGSSASSTSYTYLLAGSTGGIPSILELPASMVYTGIVTGIWASATGAARVTELT